MTTSSSDSDKFRELPLPFTLPFPPMEATRVETLPLESGWQYEPKWDGFRCLAFRFEQQVILQSKSGQPLTRYFPELVTALLDLKDSAFVLDGEILISLAGQTSFDDLLLRIHPAQSRIQRLALSTPASFLAFDILYDSLNEGQQLTELPLVERRKRLELFFTKVPKDSLIQISPATTNSALAADWFANLGKLGLDGVMAKKLFEPYHSGDREGMVKVKRFKTAECVVGGFRYASRLVKDDLKIGSLLLGLYDADGLLHFVGYTSSFNKDIRQELRNLVEPLQGGVGFTGRSPGGPSRWSTKRSMEWHALTPSLVCEVRYDYFSQHRFRHGTTFLRWRPDKAPLSCTFDQVRAPQETGTTPF